MLKNLENYKILLGSKSPRRRELLQLLRIPFTVVNIHNVEETWPEGMPACEVPLYLSGIKADAYLAHLPSVRVVHGKGTGALRNAVHSYLRKNRVVKSYRLGEFGEGDAGVTIVEFKD